MPDTDLREQHSNVLKVEKQAVPAVCRRTPRQRKSSSTSYSGDECHQRAWWGANNVSGARQARAEGGEGQGPGQPRYVLPRDHP